MTISLDSRASRWEMLRSGFANWRLPALLAYVDYRASAIMPASSASVGDMRLTLRARSGTPLRARVRDLNAAAEVFGRPEYPEEGMDWHAAGYVLDLGGHIGSFTLWAAERSPARFLVVEPDPATFDLLVANVRRLGDRVRLINAAVAAEEGSAWLEVASDSSATRLASAGRGTTAGLRVDTVTLAGLMAESGFPRFDMVKMDIEGAEYPVLHGAGRDVLRRARRWLVECHPGYDGDASGVARLFEEAGFGVEVADKADGLTMLAATLSP